MKTQHTQGKWHVYSDSIQNENGKIAEVCTRNAECKNNWQANARLIASAPELLKMVDHLKSCIERLTADVEITQFDKDQEAYWIGEAHELLYKINPDYNK